MRPRIHIGAIAISALASALWTSGCDTKSPTQPDPVCTFTISPAALEISRDGGAGAVNVTASASSCTWTASSNVSWVTIGEGANGTGPGTVKYVVAANPSTDARTGTLTIAGSTHTITEPGQPLPPPDCMYTIDPVSATFDSSGGSGSVAVTTPDVCEWLATSSASWLEIGSGGQGRGNGTISYAVEPNRNGERAATINVADRVLTVTQAAQTPIACEYGVAPVQLNPCMPSGTLTTTVSTGASCSWTVSSNVPWLTISAGESRNGPGTISFAFTSNYDAPREGLVMVRWPTPTAGQNVRVSQAGCLYAVSKTAMSFEASGGQGTFDVIQQSEPNTCGGATQDACVWTATADVSWITITSAMPRAGDNPVSFSVAPNSSTAPRTGRILVRDKAVLVTQAGVPGSAFPTARAPVPLVKPGREGRD